MARYATGADVQIYVEIDANNIKEVRKKVLRKIKKLDLEDLGMYITYIKVDPDPELIDLTWNTIGEVGL